MISDQIVDSQSSSSLAASLLSIVQFFLQNLQYPRQRVKKPQAVLEEILLL